MLSFKEQFESLYNADTKLYKYKDQIITAIKITKIIKMTWS